MIKKIGVDIIANERIKALISDQVFCRRILSTEEWEKFLRIANEKRRVEYVAGRFAAKEALIKALPDGFTIKHYQDINVLNAESGAPYIEIANFPYLIHLSISHETDYTVAFVIVEE